MQRPYRRALCWIRRDLRLSDHTALAEATALAEEVVVVFVFDTNILDALHDRDDRRVTFIHRSLEEVDAKLRAHGSMLAVRHGDPTVAIPELARSLQADVVFAARDFEPTAIERDRMVAERLEMPLVLVLDHVVQAPEDLRTGAGDPYRVFTPYSKAWYGRFQPSLVAERVPDLCHLLPANAIRSCAVALPSLQTLGFEPGDLWLEPGEDAGRARLAAFQSHMAGYAEMRDYPAAEGTSGLSVHLRFGTVSIREAFRLAIEHEDAQKWMTELVWREFYAMILATFPHVVATAFQPQYRDLEWPGGEPEYAAWCEGRTGFPIVDAAMRCLNQTGWMHNRLRMIVASFLTKDLLVDYRWGEATFARRLLDFDLASNNGGWQWAASTGVDAQPYFRIFNPQLQSRRFDADGKFIRQWCPELSGFSDDQIHAPHEAPLFAQMEAGCIVGADYPAPIVDHHVQKEAAIQLLSRAG